MQDSSVSCVSVWLCWDCLRLDQDPGMTPSGGSGRVGNGVFWDAGCVLVMEMASL